MKYQEAKKQIKSGDIILWSGRGPAARVVQFFTKSRWSHVGIAAWWGGRLMVLDSFPFKGTRARPPPSGPMPERGRLSMIVS